MFFDGVDKIGPVEIPSDGEDGVARGDALLGVFAEGAGGEVFEVFALTGAGASKGEGEVTLAEEQGEFVRGLIFDGVELLEGEVGRGIEAFVGEVGALDDVGVDGEDGEEIFSQKRSGEAEEDVVGGGGALDAKAVQIFGELAGVAISGAAENPVRKHGGGAGGIFRVGGGTGGNQKIHRD
jgi:hypothetical protein